MPCRVALWPAHLIAVFALSGAFASAQTEGQMILTVADHMNHQPPALTANDVTIAGVTITGWHPFTDGSDLELFILIDDAASSDFGAHLQELQQFVTAQPAASAIGIAYAHDGTLRIVETPTTDHMRAARALHAPSGSQSANPYAGVSDLIQRWPRKSLRREIVLIGSGISDAACASAETATFDAERAGIVVFTLYHPDANYLSRKCSAVDSGMVDLAVAGYETGGEAYFMSQNPTGSIQPFLSDIAEHLAHQYLVKFLLPPPAESGFQTIRVIPRIPGQELLKPKKVWIDRVD